MMLSGGHVESYGTILALEQIGDLVWLPQGLIMAELASIWDSMAHNFLKSVAK